MRTRSFTDEEIRRATDMYFNEGLSYKDVCGSLGYPSHSTLSRWTRADQRYIEHRISQARSYIEGSGKPVGPRKSYPYEVRLEAVRLAEDDKYAELRERVAVVFHGARGSRGYRYVCAMLRRGDDPVVVSEKVVCRIMREDGLRVAYARRKRRYSSYAGEVGEAPENLVNRDFHADAPNVLWLTDITEFRIPAGKVCLSPILDCYGGHLPAWSIALARNPLHPHLVQLGHHLRTGKAPYQHALDDALG